jgi:UDP-glucuronate decarboxylase
VIELTGSRSKLVRRPLPIDDPIQRCPDISQAQDLLKWQPKTPLRTGLKRTIEYFDRLMAEVFDEERRAPAELVQLSP